MKTENIDFEKLLIKTAFCCMASDGFIDDREVEIVKSMSNKSPLLQGFDYNVEIDRFIKELRQKGKGFSSAYFKQLENADMTKEQKLVLINFVIEIIKADDIIEYSEIRFFKNIKRRLNLNDDIIETVRQTIPDIAIFFEDDDVELEEHVDNVAQQYLDAFNLSKINFEPLKNKSKKP
ncbi:MAG: TerB family tellurite resistance protein, partial [Elusimicrobiota bacterium]|nr:TerB family tellurite resistance protein [Elusimicrobiota bacterium]